MVSITPALNVSDGLTAERSNEFEDYYILGG